MTPEKKQCLHFATEEEIHQGKVTDVYFTRTREILKSLGVKKRVRVEITAGSFPRNWRWGIFAGLGEALSLLSGRKLDVWAMKEGSVFYPGEPVLVAEGDYLELGVYETSLLGLLCQASGVATVSGRLRKAAGHRSVISFGARRMHPVIAPMIEWYAYLGGCDGVAVVKSAELLGVQPVGTMPHSLVLTLGSLEEALKAYDRVVDKGVPRIALVDTFGDEKFEALKACETLGENLAAVRLDTPASRRGDFRKIIEEVRWEMDLRGYENVKILVSGGIDEEDVLHLNDIVDGYGIGTGISNAPVIDYSMDIVEVDGVPVAKKGKRSGAKTVYRCEENLHSEVLPQSRKHPPKCRCGGVMTTVLELVISGGRLAIELPGVDDIRNYVFNQLSRVSLERGQAETCTIRK